MCGVDGGGEGEKVQSEDRTLFALEIVRKVKCLERSGSMDSP